MSLIKSMGLRIKEKIVQLLTKVKKLKGSNKSVANGMATGISVSFTPFVGFHLIIAIIIAKIYRQNRVAAAIGTMVGNPLTFPLIWCAIYQVGALMLESSPQYIEIDFTALFKKTYNALIRLDFNTFLHDIWPILYPMIIGSIPFVIISWLVVASITKKYLKRFEKEKKNDFRTRV